MRRHVRVLVLTLLLTVVPVGTAFGHPAVRASGAFLVAADYTTLTAAPAAHGNHCVLTVAATLTFAGTLDGTAEGTTGVHVLAPCDEVLAAAPGTFRDVFRFTGTFSGSVAGTPTTGQLGYTGTTRPGGAIGAMIRLRGSSTAVLRADATVGVGGSYRGVARP